MTEQTCGQHNTLNGQQVTCDNREGHTGLHFDSWAGGEWL